MDGAEADVVDLLYHFLCSTDTQKLQKRINIMALSVINDSSTSFFC